MCVYSSSTGQFGSQYDYIQMSIHKFWYPFKITVIIGSERTPISTCTPSLFTCTISPSTPRPSPRPRCPTVPGVTQGAWISFGALLMVLSSALLSGREACLSDPEEREARRLSHGVLRSRAGKVRISCQLGADSLWSVFILFVSLLVCVFLFHWVVLRIVLFQ